MDATNAAPLGFLFPTGPSFFCSHSFIHSFVQRSINRLVYARSYIRHGDKITRQTLLYPMDYTV